MKKVYLFLLGATLTVMSCSEKNQSTSENNLESSDTKKTDLSPYDLPFYIFTEKVKDENGVVLNVEVLHEEAALEWEIILGKKFDVLVEDWGTEQKDPLAEIKRMEELEQHFEYKYLEKEDNYVLYSKGIPGDSAHTDYHFYLTKKGDNDYYYTIKSNPLTQFTLNEAKVMLEASKSLKPVPANKEEPTV